MKYTYKDWITAETLACKKLRVINLYINSKKDWLRSWIAVDKDPCPTCDECAEGRKPFFDKERLVIVKSE